jgi:hypothetical protein
MDDFPVEWWRALDFGRDVTMPAPLPTARFPASRQPQPVAKVAPEVRDPLGFATPE